MGDFMKNDDKTSPVALAGESAPTATVEVASAAALPQQTFGQLLRNDLSFIPVLLTLIVIMLFFGITTNGLFFVPRNLSDLVLQIADIAVLGLATVPVLLLGEIDLSIASVATLCSVIMGVLSERMGAPAWAAILAALLGGALIGFVNGVLVAILRVPSFIITLAASIAYEGLLINLLAGQATLIINDPFILGIAGSARSYLPDIYGIGLPLIVLLLYIASLIVTQIRRQRAGLRGIPTLQFFTRIIVTSVIVIGTIILFESYLGVPYSTGIFVGLILILWLLLTKTTFGRHVYAVGGNAEAARRAGINVATIRIAVFTICSLLAAVGGILEASRGNAVASQINPTLLLDAIAAAVIGGVSLFGGRGSVWAVILGALIIGSLENGLDLKSQGQDVKEMIEGAVLAFAVIVDALVRRAQTRSGR